MGIARLNEISAFEMLQGGKAARQAPQPTRH